MRSNILIIITYIEFCFCVAFGVGFVVGVVPVSLAELGAHAGIVYRVQRGLLLVFEMLPAVLISAYTANLSMVFSKPERAFATRFSPVMFHNFRMASLMSLVCALLLMLAAELGTPLVKQQQQKSVNDRVHGEEYLLLARQSLDDGDYELAFMYAGNAMALLPASKEAAALFADVELKTNRMRTDSAEAENAIARELALATTGDVPADDADAGTPLITESSRELLKQAQDAFAHAEWFQAHYLSQMLMASTSAADPNYADAKRLSADAWNRISNPGVFIDTDAAQFFAQKRAAYNALAQNDNLKAYYLFRDLLETHPDDTDVKHYFAVAQDRMQHDYFFVDEIPDAPLFARIRNVVFSCIRPDGGHDVVYIRGIAPLRDAGRIVQYLQQLSVYSFDAAGEFEMSYTAPYAKLYAQPFSDFSADVQSLLGVSARTQNMPFLLLQGIDRQSSGIVLRPKYTLTDTAGDTRFELNHALFYLPFDDFLQIINVSASGTEAAPLLDVFRFMAKAQRYGFSAEVIQQSFYRRVSYPMVLIILMLAFAILAWNFRLDTSGFFKFSWIFLLPGLTAAVYGVVQLALYLAKLGNYAAIRISEVYAPVISGGVLLVLLTVVSICFLAQENAAYADDVP